jgi:hypothetical protein
LKHRVGVRLEPHARLDSIRPKGCRLYDVEARQAVVVKAEKISPYDLTRGRITFRLK